MTIIPSSYIQEQSTITTLPFDMLNCIKEHESEINVQNLGLTCKQLYLWRCSYIVKDSSRASQYVNKLLEKASAEEIRQSLSWFRGQLPCVWPIHLVCRSSPQKFFSSFQPITNEKLELIKQNFPRIQSLSCAPAFCVDQSTLESQSTCITIMAHALLCATIALPSAPFLITHKIIDVVFDYLPLEMRTPRAIINYCNPAPLIGKTINKITEIRDKILVKLGTRAKDKSLEAIAVFFPGIKKLELIVDAYKSDYYWFWGAPPLPAFPKVKTLKFRLTACHVEYLLEQPYDFSNYTSVTSLDLQSDRYLDGSPPAIQMRFPPQLETLTLRDGYEISMQTIDAILRERPTIKSLSLKAIRVSQGMRGIANNGVEKLFIKCYNCDYPHDASLFPQLTRLSLYQSKDSQRKYGFRSLVNFAEPSRLLHLSLKRNRPVSDRVLAQIFNKFPKLQTLTYCLPQDIQQPASHPQLLVQKLDEEQMEAHFQREHEID